MVKTSFLLILKKICHLLTIFEILQLAIVLIKRDLDFVSVICLFLPENITQGSGSGLCKRADPDPVSLFGSVWFATKKKDRF